jgi:hypothetical protein
MIPYYAFDILVKLALCTTIQNYNKQYLFKKKNFVKLSGFTENNFFLSFSINYFCLTLTRAKSEDLYNSSNTFAAYKKK